MSNNCHCIVTDGAAVSTNAQSEATVAADDADQIVSQHNSDDAKDDVPSDAEDDTLFDVGKTELGEPVAAIVHTRDQNEASALGSNETGTESSHSDIPATQGTSEGASTTLESPEDSILPAAVKATISIQDAAATSSPEKQASADATVTVQKSPTEKQFLRILQKNLQSELQNEIDGPGHLSTTPAEREAYLRTVSSNKRDRPPDFEEDRPDERTRRKIRFTPYAPVRF